MSKTSVNRRFLHRCCIQFSSLCAEAEAVEAEKQHALRFARAHAAHHPRELARALVWRVVETDDEDLPGRTGAWAVLNAVLCACGTVGEDLAQTTLAESVCAFLPYLIQHRWYTRESRRDDPSLPTAGGSSTAATAAGEHGAGRHGALREPQLLALQGKVLPMSFLDSSARGGAGSSLEQRRHAHELTRFYRGILDSWKSLWRGDVYQQLREVVRSVERNGNILSAEARTFLEVPRTFKDSLWKLRRKDPRPVMAYQALYYYSSSERLEADAAQTADAGQDDGLGHADDHRDGEDDENEEHNSRAALLEEAALAAYSRGGSIITLPSTAVEMARLDAAMHPAIKAWLRQLVKEHGGCRWCDTWIHTEDQCPCERPFRRSPSDVLAVGKRGGRGTGAQQRSVQQHNGLASSMTYMQAVDKLYGHGVSLPLKTEVALDKITSLIREQQAFGELLAAFDTVRGAVTGPVERHALWVHANYALKPSHTVFGKPNDSTPSPAMKKAESYLLAHRRYNEFEVLRHAVEVLDRSMRRCALPSSSRRSLHDIRHAESFFFCLVDGSLPSVFTPGQYARDPEAVVAVAGLKDVLCHYCLDPFHDEAHCTRSKKKEPWDLRVARTVLADNQLLDLQLPGEEHRVESAYRAIDEDDRKAKEFRKKELDLAVRLVPMCGLSVCPRCRTVGHSLQLCEARIDEVLAHEGIQRVDVRLDAQKYVFQRLRRYRDVSDTIHSADLNEAYRALLRLDQGPYPASYKEAIHELASVSIPLAAARYSNVAVSTFLFGVGSSDLLQHLAPLREAGFPHVCLYCDSYHHRSEDCSEASEEERLWLRALHRCGVELYQYVQNPSYYDERLPFVDLARGRERVLEQIEAFAKDYAAGGIGRERFLKETGLDVVASATQISAYGLMAPRSSSSGSNAVSAVGGQSIPQSQGLAGRASLYGGRFSQLIAPKDALAGELGEPRAGHATMPPAAFSEATPTAAVSEGVPSESAFMHSSVGVSHEAEPGMAKSLPAEATAYARAESVDSLGEPPLKRSRSESGERAEQDGASNTSPDAV